MKVVFVIEIFNHSMRNRMGLCETDRPVYMPRALRLTRNQPHRVP